MTGISGFVSISVIQACIFYLTQAKRNRCSDISSCYFIRNSILIEGKYEDVLKCFEFFSFGIEDSIHYHTHWEIKWMLSHFSDKDFLKLSKSIYPRLSLQRLKKTNEFWIPNLPYRFLKSANHPIFFKDILNQPSWGFSNSSLNFLIHSQRSDCFIIETCSLKKKKICALCHIFFSQGSRIKNQNSCILIFIISTRSTSADPTGLRS